MKNLDSINPAFAKPSNLCSVGASIPLILSLTSIALVNGASTGASALENPLAIFFIFTSACSLLLIFLPRIFKWDWSAKYFLVSSFEMGCISLLGGAPWLCFLVYSSIFWPYKVLLVVTYVAVISIHSRKFALMYKELKNSPEMLATIYQSEGNKTFYLQKNDVNLIEKKYKLSLFPKAAYFCIFPLLAFCTIPVAAEISEFIDLPYPHIFLGIFSIPLDMMGLAFITRGWFVFYHLPTHIKKTSSTVYVDMVSKKIDSRVSAT